MQSASFSIQITLILWHEEIIEIEIDEESLIIWEKTIIHCTFVHLLPLLKD